MVTQGKVQKTTLKLIMAQIAQVVVLNAVHWEQPQHMSHISLIFEIHTGATYELRVSRVERRNSISYNWGVSMFCAAAGPPNFIANQHKKPHLLQSRPMRLVIEANPVSVIRGEYSRQQHAFLSTCTRQMCMSQLLLGFLLRVVTWVTLRNSSPWRHIFNLRTFKLQVQHHTQKMWNPLQKTFVFSITYNLSIIYRDH